MTELGKNRGSEEPSSMYDVPPLCLARCAGAILG
jgi:hypothetical protein